jgi:hypothetical protein
MIDEKFEPANWLKQKYNNKLMQEPINIIIIDSASLTPDEAINNLIKNCDLAGYISQRGHSAEYMGYIAGNFYSQLPEGFGRAFSDSKFSTNNNHGRIFGPYFSDNKFYFICAFSREDFINNSHKFDSFIKARDNFTQNMNDKTNYHITGKIKLDNQIINDPFLTTGDHDGFAVILQYSQ